MTKEYLSEEGYALMGAAFEVHRELGGGMGEEIYQQSLELELSDRGIPFVSKPKLKVHYKTQPLDTVYIPDLALHGTMIVELKSVSELCSEHEAQLMNYLHISRSPVGYLINFGPSRGVEWKRFVMSQYIPAAQ